MRALLVLVLIIVVLGVNACMENRDTKPAKADIGRILDLDAGDMQVREDGPAAAPPLVLLHCYACSMRWWDRLVPLLRRRHVIRVDLRGHGGSEKPREGYSMGDQAKLVGEALDQLGVRNATVVGQSMGGQVATALAEARPELVARLAILDSLPSDEYRNLPLQARLGTVPLIGPAIRRVVPDALIRQGLSEAFAPGFDVPDQFVTDVNRMTYTSFRAAPEGVDDYVEAGNLPDRLANLGKPVLVLFGAEDGIVEPAKEAAGEFRRVPGATVRMLAGVGHTPQVEAPPATARLLLAFSRERPSR